MVSERKKTIEIDTFRYSDDLFKELLLKPEEVKRV